MALITNTTISSAQRGQGVKVTLGTSDTINILPTLAVGQACTCSQSSKKGTIYSVDKYGNSFIIAPITPATRFNGTSGYTLDANDTVSILIV